MGLSAEWERAVEAALRRYPQERREMRLVGRCIEARCDADEERGRFEALAERTRRIEEALAALDEQGQAFVRLRYWENLLAEEVALEMGMVERTFWRLRKKVLEIAAPYVLGCWADSSGRIKVVR